MPRTAAPKLKLPPVDEIRRLIEERKAEILELREMLRIAEVRRATVLAGMRPADEERRR